MKISITETVLRDANQSLIATRLPYEKFKDILAVMDGCGYYSVECWGGATFDSCLRYLGEDPWERLRNIRAKMPSAKLQMLLRGQNLLGYKPYPDDVVRKFVEYSVKNGIDIIRIFDALNDVRNLKVAIEETVKQGACASGTIAYTISPVHTLDNYVKLARELKEMGVSTVCIKDMAGIIGPKEAYDLVSALKDGLDLPVILHTHCTSGLAYMSVLKAAEAGVDVIDAAVSSFSGGTSQPATETLVYALSRLGFETDVDINKIKKVNDYFTGLRDAYFANGMLDPKVLVTDADALIYQVPGGMLSNLISQLKSQNSMDKFNDVLAEVPNVRCDLGYPPLVTPTSQIVGAQAVSNVLDGERYKNVSSEVKAYLRGEYGEAPGEINRRLKEKIVGADAVAGRFADNMEPLFETTKEKLGDTAKSDEDVLSYIAFPGIAKMFFAQRDELKEKKLNKPDEPARKAAGIETPRQTSTSAVPSAPEKGEVITSPLPGMLLYMCVKKGETVKKGQILLIVEAMKMEHEICADGEGVVTQVNYSPGDSINTGDPLIVLDTSL
ncbi:MAG: pyruvate carboxylase subunit B [Oscillospiraceae bacterium]|nr:pyruvate carboxylase subunit B [Oscillospiraceae bacterium]